jgi:hypothetical protein
MENWQHVTRYLNEHRYTAQNPYHEVIQGFPVHIAQDIDGSWKYREAPNGMWSRPFGTFDTAYEAAEEEAGELG